MDITLRTAVATFGAAAKAKLTNPGATGEPEDQLRAPFENLVQALAPLCGFPRAAVTFVGESSLPELKTRPDYAITVDNALIGFIELKAPGKGADPKRFRNAHDKNQWEKLRSLPNLMYTDGNEFALWQNGERVGEMVRLVGDIETSGAQLDAPPGLLGLFEAFLRWEPIPPREPKQLAELSARLCRFLREEVEEQLILKSPALTALATDWRKLLFPEATDDQFADGYAQAVTFGLLMARAHEIPLSQGLDQVARRLGRTNSLIGTALRLLTDDAENQATLKTSIGTLTRVLDAVDWPTISKGDPDAWLYFYEDFLAVYDNELRKQTGSYYTPPEVVGAMVRLVDEALRSPARFNLSTGLASSNVTVADPAVGTGTFLLGVLRSIAKTVEDDEGPGAVPAAISATMRHLTLVPNVAREQDAGDRGADPDHDTVVLLRLFGGEQGGRGVEDDGAAVFVELNSHGQFRRYNPDALLLDHRHLRAIGGRVVPLVGYQNGPDWDLPQDCVQTPDVVSMRMARHDPVELLDGHRAEPGNELGAAVSITTVNKSRGTGRRDDEGGVALANVQEVDAEGGR